VARGSLINTSIGDYRIDRLLGAGGMGEVYRGVHARLGRAVAVKVLSPEGPGASFVQRFWHEARLHATLHHPNIVELYDFIEHRGQLCIVMEYVDGEALSDRVRLRGPLPAAEAIAVFTGVTAAVAYLHSNGIVHRDIKSANVRLASSGAAKLLDFGIAKTGSTPQLTNAGAVIGTLVYLAPEQLVGAPATAQSDVWSLGLLLYEMLTGQLPFKGETARELLETIGRASFVRASVLAPRRAVLASAWRDYDRIIGRCLQKEPGDRFVDAGDLLAEVAALRPISVSPAPAFAPAPPSSQPQAPMRASRTWRPAEWWRAATWPKVAAWRRSVGLAHPAEWWRQAGRPRLEGWWRAARRPQPAAWMRPASWLPLLERHWAGLAAAAVVSLIVLAVVFVATRPRPVPATPTETPAVGTDTRTATPGTARTSHRIEVVGGAADVYIDGVRRGRTPFDYQAAPGETIRLDLREEGFVPVSETFDVTTRPVWTFVMRRSEGSLP